MAASAEYIPAARPRMERVESLIKKTRALALAAAAVASAESFAGPVVANQAAATALPLATYTTKRQIYTVAQEAIWQYIPGVPGTIGVPPLAADEVIAAAGGVLARTDYSSPKWRTGVNDIFIDPANPAASNENTGFDAGVPLLTGLELFRRWGWGNQVLVGPNVVTSPDGFTNIHIVSNVVAPDSLPMNVITLPDASIRFIGGTPTNILPATVLTAVTAMVPATNTRLRLTAGALVWTPFIAANRRGRITTGAAAGATFQVQTDVGGGAADVSAAQTTNEPGFSILPTTVTPAPGDSFVIESLVQCNFGLPFNVETQNNPLFGTVFVNIVNLNLPSMATQAWAPTTDNGAVLNGAEFNFYNCTIDRNVDYSQGNIVSIASYYFNASITNLGMQGFISSIQGGGANSAAPAIYSIVIGGNHEDAMVDLDFVANRANLFVVLGPVRNFASTTAQAFAGGLNTGAHAIFVGGGGTSGFFSVRGMAVFKGTAWGAGGVGRGIYVSAGCDAIGAPQVATGAAGDFALANRTTGWFFDAALAIYAPAAAPLAFSWANLAGAQPAGFAGDAHNPVQDCHWVPVETTA